MWALRRVAFNVYQANQNGSFQFARVLASQVNTQVALTPPSPSHPGPPRIWSQFATVAAEQPKVGAGDFKVQTLNDQGGFDTSAHTHKDDGEPPAPHPTKLAAEKGSSYMLMHPVYSDQYVRSIVPKHRPPVGIIDNLAYYSIGTIRTVFDFFTGYGPNMTADKWLQRIVFLETVAGVPGMVGAMIRHLHSLRLLRRDQGWIHTLLEEAENERMHLLTFLEMRKPGLITRTFVLLAQGIFCNFFFLSYLVSPKYCHRLVGYLEEEAVRTYTHLLSDIETGKLPEWQDAKVPQIAINYWRLKEDATMLDLIYAVRADEAGHSYVNHTFAGLKQGEENPFSTGSHEVP